MKRLKLFFIGCLVVCVLPFIAMYFMSLGERRYVDYKDHAAASVPGDGIPNGWIPPFLPNSAVKIRTLQDIDNGASVWNKFSYKSQDDLNIRQNCRLLSVKNDIEYFACTEKWCAVIDSKNGLGSFHSDENDDECLRKDLDPEND